MEHSFTKQALLLLSLGQLEHSTTAMCIAFRVRGDGWGAHELCTLNMLTTISKHQPEVRDDTDMEATALGADHS